MVTILLAILIFGLIIIVHELGHFMTAKATGIKVIEFSIGMGPVLWGKKIGETFYSLRILPIGGFNKMSGMEPGEEEDPRGFNKKSVLQRMVVISAGSIMNFLLAVLLFIIIFGFIGVPTNSNVVGDVLEGMPAEKAGIQVGDKIIGIDGKETKSWEDLTNAIHKKSGETINIELQRNGKILSINVIPVKDKDSDVGLIGIIYSTEKYGLFKSIGLGISKAFGILKLIVVGLVQMIAGEVEAEVAGPVGIVQMIGQVATYGLSSLLSFAAILSVNLGLINILPIPALDGSRLVFLLIEGIRGKKLDIEKENFVHLIGFVLLIALLIIVTYQDLIRIFN